MEERIKKVIGEQLGLDPRKLVERDKFIDDLGADSLDCIELVMALEEKFNIEIPDEDANKLLTVKDVIVYIESKVCPEM